MKAKRTLRKKVRALEAQKLALLRELFSLQKFANEIVARLDAKNAKEAA